jgi:heme/copper-type cytochrome/quinol oxidase subunit 2
VKRLAVFFAVVLVALAAPAGVLAHDAPENDQSNWIMADWMLDTFFIFSGFALVVFLVAWKLGHFQDLDKAAAIPLLVEEEDYYTPDWALDDEEWD